MCRTPGFTVTDRAALDAEVERGWSFDGFDVENRKYFRGSGEANSISPDLVRVCRTLPTKGSGTLLAAASAARLMRLPGGQRREMNHLQMEVANWPGVAMGYPRDTIMGVSFADQIFGISGKVALVTGGYRGIGAAISLGLAGMGARIAVTGIESAKAAAFAESLRVRRHDAYSATFDVISAAETQRMVDGVVEHFGRLDILVNCVGVNREQKAEEVTEEVFDNVVAINLKGAMFQAQAAARHMIRQQSGGKQVHIGSVRTQLALRDRGYAAYCATKGGLGTLCKQLAAEWAPHGINVNIVAPTFVNTEMSASMLADENFYRGLVSRIPLGRIAETEDVMRAVLFFVSPASDFITGQTLYVDGGITATQ
jgi:gluconate 5-dehydrogenase